MEMICRTIGIPISSTFTQSIFTTVNGKCRSTTAPLVCCCVQVLFLAFSCSEETWLKYEGIKLCFQRVFHYGCHK